MVSVLEFLPKLLAVSTHTTGKTIRFTTGKKNKITHQVGLFIIFIKTIPLYTGTKASQGFSPALT